MTDEVVTVVQTALVVTVAQAVAEVVAVPLGASGPQGAAGIAGSSVTADAGPPSQDIGGDGDVYIDVSTGDIYVKS